MPVFPAGPDNITEAITPGTPQAGIHSALHNQVADAVNAIEEALLPGGDLSLDDHRDTPDPHPQYLTQGEGDVRYETDGAVMAHVAEGDPHPVYLTQTEADARYDLAGAAGAGDAAHVASPDPHPVYLTQAEADARYVLTTAPVTGVDVELRTYIQTIMAVLDPGGPPVPSP